MDVQTTFSEPSTAMAQASDHCPCCGSPEMSRFYEVRKIPIHSVLLMPTREVALNYPKGDIELGFCQACGFISNLAFESGIHEYSFSYEETQSFSPTFREFHRRLAADLIQRYDLRNKTVIEIGCGKGEFLDLLCELGQVRGIGFDPAFIKGRISDDSNDRATFIKDFYSEKYAHYHADFVCCKMTLEHIHATADFLRTLRRSIGNRFDTVVFFQVPDVLRILRETAFWDIYYEHCSYFSAGSFARLFRGSGFEVTALWKDYDDQYLMIEVRPTNRLQIDPFSQENDLQQLAHEVQVFSQNYRYKLETWRSQIQEIKQSRQKVVVWGGGSKGVAFLTVLNIRSEIEYVVDIDPYKWGTYIAGTGQEIVAPDFLLEYQPNTVIVMNAIYREEIRRQLQQMGLASQITVV